MLLINLYSGFFEKEGVLILGSMLKDLMEYREVVKKQLDDLEFKINTVLVEGELDKALELSKVMDSTFNYYRGIEEEIEKVEKIFEVK